jgi:acyl carrier protein
MNADVKKAVRAFLVENFMFRGEIDKLPDSASLVKSGILDSVGILLLISFMEDTYDMKVSDEEVEPENLESVDNITAFIERKSRGEGS